MDVNYEQRNLLVYQRLKYNDIKKYYFVDNNKNAKY
jgi:hypothetical protein